MKTKENESKGITLIALVVTIVVLLILAGITINMLIGENGILIEANKAKTQNDEAKDLEIVRLSVMTGKLENITQGTEINAAIQKELRRTDSAATVEGDGEEKDITYNSKLYKINIETGTAELEEPFEKPDYNDAMKTLKQGDFVTYDTGIEETGKVLCIVLHDASSEYGLQIITNDCIKQNGEYVDLTYGEDFGSDDESYERVKTEYNDLIKILNREASKYLNQDYAIDARCVGSNPKNKNSETKTTTIYEYENWDGEKESEDTGIRDADTNYEIDYEELEKFNLLNTNKSYWLASRYNQVQMVYTHLGIHFYLRTVGAEVERATLRYSNEEKLNRAAVVTHGLRPVFLLRGDLKIERGSGTENAPYELGV